MKRIIINKKLVLDEMQRLIGPIDLSEDKLNEVLKMSTIQKYKKHEMILNEGESGEFFGVVLKGMVQIFHYQDNKLVSDFFASEGSGFFEVNSFLTGKTSESYIEALEPTIIAKFERKTFTDDTDIDPMYDRVYRRILQYAIKCSNERLNSILHESAEQKYANLERRIPGLTSRVSAINIASYIGVTQETLCRIKSKQTDLI